MKVHYAKPYLTIDEQIDLLASRGLRIKDRLVARDLLTGVNYYRLTGYAIPFSIDREHFKKGATLSDLIAVYLFDRKFYGYRPLNEWRNTPTATLDTRTFFAQLLLVYRMLRPLPSVCFDRTRWRRVVYRLLRDTPNCSVFDMDRIMDIPADYRKKFLWQ